ncbi:MAG: (d)CMP kinase [Mycoplasmataceae bacterium]|nr:(d)CMP kinase [Mycoplasmataceae bacterium]
MNNNNLRISIDGGVATGKSTIAEMLAKKLHLNYFSTGKMYRLITLFALKNNLIDSEDEIISALQKEKIWIKNSHLKSSIPFDKLDLESDEVTLCAPKVAAMKKVREYARVLQEELVVKGKIVLEGRDIGTIIMPNADFKFFLVVSPHEAAKRRQAQNIENNFSSNYNEIFANIIKRDKEDTSRDIAPLIKANSSITINTDNKNLTQIINEMLGHINETN